MRKKKQDPDQIDSLFLEWISEMIKYEDYKTS